jgi:hypothetical protein
MGEGAQPQDLSVPFFGRRDDVRRLTASLRARKSCLVPGPKGMGKTRLIQESLAIALQPSVFLERPVVLHQLLAGLAERMLCPAGCFGSVLNATSLFLKHSVLNLLRKQPRCLVLEDVAGADPRMYRFLQQVYYSPAVCLIVTATSREGLGHLRKLLWDPREEITLRPLTRTAALDLFDLASRTYHLESLDLDEFRRRVLTAAQGNPGQILAMCRMASRPEYQHGRHIKFLPLRIDALTAFIT